MSEIKRFKTQKELEILKLFFNIFCNNIHPDREKSTIIKKGILERYDVGDVLLCNECKRHFIYSTVKLVLCPYIPKPSCKKCPAICYSEHHRAFMKNMMRYSGKYLILHGRFDLIFRYFF